MTYYLAGGRTGDLIYNLMVIKQKGDTENVLLLTDNLKYGGDLFHYDIDKTINDLSPFLLRQSYISKVEKLIGEPPLNFVNLNDWRSSPLLFKGNIMKILQGTYNILPINKWIDADVIDEFKNTCVIHRSLIRHNPNFPWESIIENEEDIIFITLNPTEYHNFKFKDKVKMHLCGSFLEFVNIINSSKKFFGNMSAPLAIAHALDHPRFAELYHKDQMHYIGDEEVSKNFNYLKE